MDRPTRIVSEEAVARLENLISSTKHGSINPMITTQIYLTLHSIFGDCMGGDTILKSPSCAVADPVFYFLLAYVDMRMLGSDTENTYVVSPAEVLCMSDVDCGTENMFCRDRQCLFRDILE